MQSGNTVSGPENGFETAERADEFVGNERPQFTSELVAFSAEGDGSDVDSLVSALANLGMMTYQALAPMALDVLIECAPQRQVEDVLDQLSGYMEDEKIEKAYKLVCRTYLDVYPQLIHEHVEMTLQMIKRDKELMRQIEAGEIEL